MAETGFANLTINPKTISEVVASAQAGKACTIPLKTLVDATVFVEIAQDKREAFLTLRIAEGTAHPGDDHPGHRPSRCL